MALKDNRMIKLDGCNLYIFDDTVYIDESNYSHFYKLEDVFNFYSEVKKLLYKDIVFCFKEFEFYIGDNTTFEDILTQLEKQNITEDKDRLTEDKNKFKDYYVNYLRENNNSLYELFYKSDIKMPKILKKSEK